MGWDQLEGKWKQTCGQMKEKWGRLTDDDLEIIAGRRDKLIGKRQGKHGLSKEEAERQLDEWQRYAGV
jgi:uncharacterized protein YjbJ (UPF0337 family)